MGRAVGVDAHRDFLQVTVRERGEVERCRVATESSELHGWMRSLRRDDHVFLESTSFAWPIAQMLVERGLEVTVTNPAKTKAIAAAKVKSDKVDADTLAMLGEADLMAPVWVPDHSTLALRRQVMARQQLVRHRTTYKRQIRAILTRNLIRPPMPDPLSSKGRPWLDVVELPLHDRVMLDSLVRMHSATEDEIALVERTLAGIALDRPDTRLLMTIPGVASHTALALCSTIGDITRFPTARHLVGYLGLDPRVRQSGIGPTRTGRISKQGSSHTRAMLVEAATAAVRTPGPLRAMYRRIRTRKGHCVAVVAVARKITIITWHMLTTGETYRYSLPSLTSRKLYDLERKAGREVVHRDQRREHHATEKALLTTAEELYEEQVRARASHRNRDKQTA